MSIMYLRLVIIAVVAVVVVVVGGAVIWIWRVHCFVHSSVIGSMIA